MWYWRWTDHVKSGEVLHRVKEQRNVLHTINRVRDNWICHILHNCLLKHVIEGKIGGRMEVTGRWRICKQLLDEVTRSVTRKNYVGHLESKERLRIQPAQLFNFGTHSTILHTVWTWHHRTFTSSWRWRSTLLVNDVQMTRTCSTLSWTGWIARRPSGTRRE